LADLSQGRLCEDVQDLWNDFIIPLADKMAHGIHRAIEEFHPEIVVGDQHAIAAGLVADKFGIPWVTSATTSSQFSEMGTGPTQLSVWIENRLAHLRARIGDPQQQTDPRFSPHLILAYTTRALIGQASRTLTQLRCAGPALDEPPSKKTDFPARWIDSTRALVVVTLDGKGGARSARFLDEAMRALLERRRFMQAIIVAPRKSLVLPADAAADIMLRNAQPPLSLLDQADAIVCQADHRTVCKALWHGLPLIVAPMHCEEAAVSRQVTDAHAGIELDLGKTDVAEIGATLDRILGDASYRSAAQRIGKSLRTAGGAAAAVRYLEDMTRTLDASTSVA
jgi:UDP:flavonoid glycosyltransferase YjiC (YdhE family)